MRCVSRVFLVMVPISAFLLSFIARCTEQVLLPLAWATSSLSSRGFTLDGASIIAFGLGDHIFVVAWLYSVWREYDCVWPWLSYLSYRIAARHVACVLLVLVWVITPLLSFAERHMARASLPLAWVTSSLPSYGCVSYGATASRV